MVYTFYLLATCLWSVEIYHKIYEVKVYVLCCCYQW